MRVLVTGGAGFIGSHVVDALRGRRARGARARPRARRRCCPPASRRSIGDVTDAGVGRARRCAGSTRCATRPRRSGSASTSATPSTTCATTTSARPTLLRRAARAPVSSGRSCSRRAWSSTAKVATGARSTAWSRRARARRPISTPAGSSRRARSVAPRSRRRPVPETARLDPRNVYAATKVAQEHLAAAFAREHPAVAVTALRYHNVYGPGMPRDTPYAGVAASSPTRSAPVGRRGSSRTAASSATSSTSATSPPPTSLALRAGRTRRVQRRERLAAPAARDGRRARGRVRADAPRPEVVGGWRPGDVRHVFASPERARAELGFDATSTSPRGCGSSRGCSAPDASRRLRRCAVADGEVLRRIVCSPSVTSRPSCETVAPRRHGGGERSARCARPVTGMRYSSSRPET